MTLSKPVSLVVGFITLLPGVYMAMFFASIFMDVNSANPNTTMPIFGSFGVMMTLHLLTMLLSVALLIFYIVHLFKNAALEKDARIIWVILLLFGNFIAAIIYWWLYIWRPPSETLH